MYRRVHLTLARLFPFSSFIYIVIVYVDFHYLRFLPLFLLAMLILSGFLFFVLISSCLVAIMYISLSLYLSLFLSLSIYVCKPVGSNCAPI